MSFWDEMKKKLREHCDCTSCMSCKYSDEHVVGCELDWLCDRIGDMELTFNQDSMFSGGDYISTVFKKYKDKPEKNPGCFKCKHSTSETSPGSDYYGLHPVNCKKQLLDKKVLFDDWRGKIFETDYKKCEDVNKNRDCKDFKEKVDG